jgi:ABC-type molybdenum transport system ATPase subunit/photorepair protein PhrA
MIKLMIIFNAAINISRKQSEKTTQSRNVPNLLSLRIKNSVGLVQTELAKDFGPNNMIGDITAKQEACQSNVNQKVHQKVAHDCCEMITDSLGIKIGSDTKNEVEIGKLSRSSKKTALNGKGAPTGNILKRPVMRPPPIAVRKGKAG